MSHTNQGYWLANPTESHQQYQNPWLNNPVPTNTRELIPLKQDSQQSLVFGVYQGDQQTTERPNWMGQQTLQRKEVPAVQSTWTPWVPGVTTQQVTIPDWGMFHQPASTRGGNQQVNTNRENVDVNMNVNVRVGPPEYQMPPRGSATR